MNRRHLATAALLALVLLSSAACTTTTTTRRNGADQLVNVPVQRLDLDPTLIQVNPDGKHATLNAEDVFRHAYKAYSARRYEEAVKHYQTIVTYFPDSRFVLPSLYNGGLASEKLERWDEASANYRLIIQKYPKQPDAKDAYFRMARMNLKLDRPKETVELMTEVMLRPDLNHFDRVEAHVRRATALLELGQAEDARQGFQSAISLNRRAPAEDRLADNAEFMVQAQFGIGSAFHHQVLAIPLVLPPERMRQDLNRQGELFLRAQASYIRAIRAHHPRWSVAAGFMVGRLYEDFYIHIFSAEIPDEVRNNPEALKLYFSEVRKHIRPLMVRAIQVYEKNISFSKRIDADLPRNQWAADSKERLARLKAYLDDPSTQRRAERLVVQRRPLKHLWDPRYMAQDAVDDAIQRARTSQQRTPSPAPSPKS